ncbi:hypothetical protein RJT34_32548 [Clitoria ternatea]|uniref:Uncharacterized protein n=1 Tax=Clitoria ternatea TaxID=43366 RepID=A0AAN9EYD0_CLITE
MPKLCTFFNKIGPTTLVPRKLLNYIHICLFLHHDKHPRIRNQYRVETLSTTLTRNTLQVYRLFHVAALGDIDEGQIQCGDSVAHQLGHPVNDGGGDKAHVEGVSGVGEKEMSRSF